MPSGLRMREGLRLLKIPAELWRLMELEGLDGAGEKKRLRALRGLPDLAGGVLEAGGRSKAEVDRRLRGKR